MKRNHFFTRKIIPLISGLILLIPLLSGCGNGQRMMFGTGGTAGTYYAYGGVLAQYMREYAGIRVTAVSTGGSKVNLQSIQDGDFQLGFTQSDVLTYAWNGTRAFQGEGENHDFRVLGALYAETVQLFTMDKNIRTVEDLKGKSVSIGQSGSGVYFNALDVLSHAGLSLKDIKPQYQSFEDSKEAMKDGKIRLIPIEGKIREQILKDDPYYKAFTIPKGTYPGQEEDIATIAVEATVVVSADANPHLVYQLTAAIFDHAKEIAKENARGEELNVEKAASVKTVPYHDGAAKYYEEKGYQVRTKE